MCPDVKGACASAKKQEMSFFLLPYCSFVCYATNSQISGLNLPISRHFISDENIRDEENTTEEFFVLFLKIG